MRIELVNNASIPLYQVVHSGTTTNNNVDITFVITGIPNEEAIIHIQDKLEEVYETSDVDAFYQSDDTYRFCFTVQDTTSDSLTGTDKEATISNYLQTLSQYCCIANADYVDA